MIARLNRILSMKVKHSKSKREYTVEGKKYVDLEKIWAKGWIFGLICEDTAKWTGENRSQEMGMDY